MSLDFWKGLLCCVGVVLFICVFYYAQEVRHYRYLEHEAAMMAINRCQP